MIGSGGTSYAGDYEKKLSPRSINFSRNAVEEADETVTTMSGRLSRWSGLTLGLRSLKNKHANGKTCRGFSTLRYR